VNRGDGRPDGRRNLGLHAFPLKVFDDVSYHRKTLYATNAILCPFNAKQIADGGMGLNEPQNYSALSKFSVKFKEHPGARQIDPRRS
jgi:hypothetical protein